MFRGQKKIARFDKTRDCQFGYGPLMKVPRILWIILSANLTSATAMAAVETDPETVLVTYHVKADKADELARLIDRTWATYQRLGLVFDKPHLVMRGKEKGGEFFAEILPWKTHSGPDNAPAEVHALWDEMQKVCEKRDGRDGIEIPEIEIVRNES
jgi:hypothetical protein